MVRVLVYFANKDVREGMAFSVGRQAEQENPVHPSLSPRTGLARPTGGEELP